MEMAGLHEEMHELAEQGTECRYERLSAGTDDYLIPAAAQTLAPAIAQMAEALSKPSLTTVDSMLAVVTHTGSAGTPAQ
jgi:hypothetical protein